MSPGQLVFYITNFTGSDALTLVNEMRSQLPILGTD